MKKTIFFVLIGGVILFAWQFLSFGTPNFHKAASEYTPTQDAILDAIDQAGLKEGMYYLGQADPSLDKEAYDAATEGYNGKPWAVLSYHENMEMSMAMNMIRGLIMMFIVAWIFFWIIKKQQDPTLMKRILAGLAVGFIGFCFIPYSNFIWYKEPDIWAYLLDGTVPWIILGFIGHKMA